MGLIGFLIFTGVFGVVALVAIALTTEASQQAKQVHATLDSALATDRQEDSVQLVNFRKSDLLSSIPWLNRRLLKIELAPQLQRLLYQADLKWNAGGLLAGCALLYFVGAYLTYLRLDNAFVAILIGIPVGALPFIVVFRKRSRRLHKFQQGLPEALDMMVNSLRAGQSLIASMGSVARECADPIGCEFKACFEEQNYGLEMKTALDNLIERVPLQDLRIVVTAIMIQKESGGNLAEVLDKTSHVIRERFRLKKQIEVFTAQGRLTGWILTFLPIVLGVAMYFVNPTMMSILWTDPVGLKLLWTAIGMLILGGLIIRKIVNMDV